MRSSPKILLVEDDPTVARELQGLLQRSGYSVQTADRAQAGLDVVEREKFDAVVTDLQLPGAENGGLNVLETLHSKNPQLPVILMTGHHTADAAIAATKLGAYDYLLKPLQPPDLLQLLDRAVKSKRFMADPVDVGAAQPGHDAIIGRSRAMVEIYKAIGVVATKPASVLIRGETGTGKELVARYIYQHSERADKPLIAVNCPAIPENLLESELFGHEAGAFTGAHRRVGRFEQANGGTIFLDEIGDISLGTQAKLLRVLQDKIVQRLGGNKSLQVDVRVIAATHRDLEAAVEAGQFRSDLYYRLNDAVIRLPPLRERREDIPELINFFLDQEAADFNAAELKADDEAPIPRLMLEKYALEFLQYQPWPGNVRELQNVIRKAALLARKPSREWHAGTINVRVIHKVLDETRIFYKSAEGGPPLSEYVSQLLDEAERGDRSDVAGALADWTEREIYGQALRLANSDQSKMAKWLGISRPTVRQKLIRYDLRRPDQPQKPVPKEGD